MNSYRPAERPIDVGAGAAVWPGLYNITSYLANLKNDDSTVSITNTGCIRRDNQCREQIDEVLFLFLIPSLSA